MPVDTTSTTVLDRPLHTSVRCLSTAASSFHYLAFFGGSTMPSQHTRSTASSVAGQLLCNSLPDSLKERSRSWQGQLQTSHLFTLFTI